MDGQPRGTMLHAAGCAPQQAAGAFLLLSFFATSCCCPSYYWKTNMRLRFYLCKGNNNPSYH